MKIILFGRIASSLTGIVMVFVLLSGCASSQANQPVQASPTGGANVSHAIPQALTLFTLSGHSGGVVGLAWSPDGKRLASASDDTTVKIWEAATGQAVLTFKQHTSYVWAVAWSPDGKEVASAGNDQTVQIWNPTTGKVQLAYQGFHGAIYGLAWSPDSKKIAIGGDGQNAQVIDTHSGKAVVNHQGQTGSRIVAWSPDGKKVASAGQDGTIQLWDASTGNTLQTLGDHKTAFWAVAWSPDGKEVATAAGNNNSQVTSEVVQTWSATDGHALHAYTGHERSTVDWGDGVFGIAWSPDGKKLASGGADGMVLVWDRQSGNALAQSHAHAQVIWSVAWSPDGTRVASASQDRSVVISSVG